MPISLIILKCFGSVHPSAVTNIKYFSTSPFSSPPQASGEEKDETYIIEFLPSILDKDKENFLSSLKTVLLSLMKEPTPKILSYKLEFCLQTFEDVNEVDETPEYLKSLGIDKHVLELNEMWDEDFKERGYYYGDNVFPEYSVVHTEFFSNLSISILDDYVENVFSVLSNFAKSSVINDHNIIFEDEDLSSLELDDIMLEVFGEGTILKIFVTERINNKNRNINTYKSNKTTISGDINGKRSFSSTSHINNSISPPEVMNTHLIDSIKASNFDKSFKFDSPIYKNLETLIIDNPINEDTQKNIEKFLLDYSYIIISNKPLQVAGINYSIINPKLTKIFLETKEDLIKQIINYKNDMSYSNNLKIDFSDLEIAEIINKVNEEAIINILYGHILKILSTYNKSVDNTNSMVNISYEIGKSILNIYYYNEYSKLKKSANDTRYSLSKWKIENDSKVKKYEDSTFIFKLGSLSVSFAINCNLLEIKTLVLSKSEKLNAVWPTEKLRNTITNQSVLNFPKKIPMIVRPKPYTNMTDGGYLLNDEYTTDSIIQNKWNNREPSQIKNKNVIYDLINNINSVGYKINTNVLEFILYRRPDYFKDEINDFRYKHPLLDKRKLTKKEKVELDSYLSKKELQENILGLASVFSNIPEFYIPVNLDFRGRLYCTTEYLNYQSNDLAKSLLLFSKPGKIYKNDTIAINYLKMFGATCFGLNKESLVNRISWVDKNLDNIIDFENGKLIKEAKNKFLFLSFCFEYNRWLKCLENHDTTWFDTYLPIQMDATCNGFQHLSLLSLDAKLGLELNFTASTWKDKPKDFYSFLVTSLMDYFKTELDNNNKLSLNEKEGYQRLINGNIKRNIIKKSVMTIPYNVSNYQLINYIKDNFELMEDSKVWYYSKDDNELQLKSSDFTLLGKGLKKVLNYKFHKLSLLLKYLEDLAIVCTLLEIPILWTLPSGLEVKQSYMLTDEIRIKPFHYSNKRFSLKILNKGRLNSQKQIIAFMPNLVHSLDAASLALLLTSFFKEIEDVKNIYTIHDCFAVTANNMDNLINMLKLTYIKIYSEEMYILKLDKGIRDNIKNVYGDNALNDETLQINVSSFTSPLYFPDVNIVLGKKIEFDFKSLKKSSYIIN